MGDNLILLVEDDPDRVTLTLRAFEEHPLDVDVEVARDADEALERLQSDRTRVPGLILLDLKLPESSGFEVLEAIRERPETRFVPVVVLTSSLEEADRRESYERGANSFVSRPVSFEQLRRELQEIGTYWLEINQTPDPDAR